MGHGMTHITKVKSPKSLVKGDVRVEQGAVHTSGQS